MSDTEDELEAAASKIIEAAEAAEAAAALAPPEAQSPEEIISGLQAQVAELKDQALRAVAEAENVRRRAAREKLEASKYAIANLARDLLAVTDTLGRAIGSITEETSAAGGEALKSLAEGMEITQRQLLGIFERHGITPINPLGGKFDPNFHQAVFESPSEGQPDGVVIQVLQPGYVIGERLLRPAMVGVAKNMSASKGGDTPITGGTIDTTA